MAAEMVAALLEANNLVLIIILILLFVVGYKLMKAVMEMVLIAIFSGLFLVAMAYVGIGPEVSITRFILFMALGVGLYLGYNTLATATNVMSLLWNIVTGLLDVVRNMIGAGADMVGSMGGSKKSKNKEGSSGDDGSSEKMAILQEVDDDE